MLMARFKTGVSLNLLSYLISPLFILFLAAHFIDVPGFSPLAPLTYSSYSKNNSYPVAISLDKKLSFKMLYIFMKLESALSPFRHNFYTCPVVSNVADDMP